MAKTAHQTPVYNSSDRKLSAPLANQVAGLRGGMVAQAETIPMPPRFDAVPHPDRPAMIITDIETGRATEVPMYSYGVVRAALADLF